MFNEFRNLFHAKASQLAYFFPFVCNRQEKNKEKTKIWPPSELFHVVLIILLYARLSSLHAFCMIRFILFIKTEFVLQ